MGVANILAMWKIIAATDFTWVRFKAYFQEVYLDMEELKQTAGAEEYGISNNVKHGKMKDIFMNFASATAAQDAALTQPNTTSGNLSN